LEIEKDSLFAKAFAARPFNILGADFLVAILSLALTLFGVINESRSDGLYASDAVSSNRRLRLVNLTS
jgi:hypothetical protein